MANPEIINNDGLQLELFKGRYEDGVIKFTAALTYALGVIMAKLLVSAGTVTPDVGNTGDGTVTNFDLAPGGPPIPGNWNFECTYAVTEGGVFKLEDPNGEIVADNITLRVGSGLITNLSIAGLKFDVTDGATDFVAGDKFALNVVDEESKWVPWVEDAFDGSGDAQGVLPIELTSAGAEDFNRRMFVEGWVNFEKLSVQAGGAVPQKALDQLRDWGIAAVKSVRIDILDNQ